MQPQDVFSHVLPGSQLALLTLLQHHSHPRMYLKYVVHHKENRHNSQGASAVRRNGWQEKKVSEKTATLGFVDKKAIAIQQNDVHHTAHIPVMLALLEHSLGADWLPCTPQVVRFFSLGGSGDSEPEL